MKFLGIDYGTKMIGLALSDDEGLLAYPYKVLPRDANILSAIKEICDREKVGGIVMGKSISSQGLPNEVQKDIEDFSLALKIETGLTLESEQESFSTYEARTAGLREKPVANPRRKGSRVFERMDDRAAAVILQRFLDRKKNV